MAKTYKILTRWQVWTYDVWGNKRDGYEVNDRYKQGEREIAIALAAHNVGTANEFYSAALSDKQIKEAIGFSCAFDDPYAHDITVYAERESDGYPLGEMECLSHKSLTFMPSELIVGKRWWKVCDVEQRLMLQFANGQEIYAGSVAQVERRWRYALPSKQMELPQSSENPTLLAAKCDLLDEAIAAFRNKYQFTTNLEVTLDYPG